MAIIKTTNKKGRYHNLDARQKEFQYITRPDKAIHGYIGAIGTDPHDPVSSMDSIAVAAGKTVGVQLRSFIVSFFPNELTSPTVAYQIGKEISHCLAKEYQTVFAVHEDKPHLHIHIMINAVSYLNGHRYRGTKQEFHSFKNEVARILRRYGITQLIYVQADGDYMSE